MTDELNDASNAANQMAEGLQNMLTMAEGVAGYVKTLVDGGISQEMAEQMGKSYHDSLMEQMKASIGLNALKSLAQKGQRR